MSKKLKNDPFGSLYIKITSKQNGKWILMRQTYQAGIRSQKAVGQNECAELGLKNDLSIEEARERVKRLNSEHRLEVKQLLNSAEKPIRIKKLKSFLFPQTDVDIFQEQLKKEHQISGSTELHLKKLFSHFEFIREMILSEKLRINPQLYSEKTEKIYEYLLAKKVSVNYADRLISMLNKWGFFYAKRYGTFFEPVKKPRGKIRGNFSKIQKTKIGKDSEKGVRTASLPMTEELLNSLKFKMPEEFYNFIHLTLYFGLRPQEASDLHSKENWRVGIDKKEKIPFIEVYQSKLTSIEESERWKRIPILFVEQQECIRIIKSGNFKRPHPKTMRKYANGNYTLYAGRKAFIDLMLERGQEIQNISAWLGHRKLDTSYKYYFNKYSLKYTPTDEIEKLYKKAD